MLDKRNKVANKLKSLSHFTEMRFQIGGRDHKYIDEGRVQKYRFEERIPEENVELCGDFSLILVLF